jgi:arabinoxylan arabinofuranohydrolase
MFIENNPYMKIVLFHMVLVFAGATALTQKPVLPDFHADPSAHVWEGRIWVYPSHDIAGSEYWDMTDWHCFSSEDLVNWTDHGVIFSLHDISWADKYAWAPDCIRRNGKYYFYFPADDQIGVAVSHNPDGPFKDALGQPLIAKNQGETRAIDPAVLIDGDGQAYLYYGQDRARVVKLSDDMISLSGDIISLDIENFHEGIWVHKVDSLYYVSYASSRGDKVANLLEYSIGRTPYGPFEYKGVIMDNRSRNIHHSIVMYGDQWYVFYHVQGPSPYERRVCMEKIYYSPDGTIKPVRMGSHP